MNKENFYKETGITVKESKVVMRHYIKEFSRGQLKRKFLRKKSFKELTEICNNYKRLTEAKFNEDDYKESIEDKFNEEKQIN